MDLKLHVCFALRKSKTRPQQRVPIIAMTAAAMKGDRERFLAADMDDYLSKPIDFDEFARLLNKLAQSMSGRPTTTSSLPNAPVSTPAVPRDDEVMSNPTFIEKTATAASDHTAKLHRLPGSALNFAAPLCQTQVQPSTAEDAH